MKHGGALTLAGVLALVGCNKVQSPLVPRSDQARAIHHDFIRLVTVDGVMFALVLIFLAWAIVRGRRGRGEEALTGASAHAAPSPFDLVLTGWVALIVAGLLVLSIGSFLTDASLARDAPQPLQLKIAGAQWWWDIHYDSPDPADPSQGFDTANELHLPVNRPVDIELDARDVIHSFWVPELHGKMDLIPGHQNHIRFTPRQVGWFRGQCAEFCGLQHAHMAIQVVVEPQAQFDAWRRNQAAAAAQPSTVSAQAGQQVFLSKACSNCHQIRGTDAGGVVGPDLTHLASRTTLAAGTMKLTRGALAGWIANPQGLKPGANMPAVPLSGDELNALVDYLEGLK